MSRSQIGITLAAVVVAVLMFLLPKGIIKKEKAMPEKTAPIAEKEVVPSEVHKSKVTADDSRKIEEWSKAYLKVSNTEKKIKFADSLASIFRKLHQYDSSAKYLEEISRLNPTPGTLEKAGDAYNMAFTVASEGEKPSLNEKTRVLYGEVLKKAPHNMEVKSKLAMTYVGTDNPMEGIMMLREVLKEDPKNETAIYNLGILSLQSGQYEKAVERFKHLVEINPSNANAHFYLGMSFMNTGDKKKARIAFEAARALENDPGFQATVESYLKELEEHGGEK